VPHRSLDFARRIYPLTRAAKAPTGFGVPVWRNGAQKPAEGNCIYRVLGTVIF